jgi:hypothetical protein
VNGQTTELWFPEAAEGREEAKEAGGEGREDGIASTVPSGLVNTSSSASLMYHARITCSSVSV